MLVKSFVFAAFLCKFISSRMQDFALDVDDILSDNLMPVSFLMLENKLLEERVEGDSRNSSLKTLDEEFQCVTKDKIAGDDGTFSNAFNSMRFHREMFSNFLCSKFIAGKILDDIQPKVLKGRLGLAKFSTQAEGNNSLSFDGGAVKSRMLFDEGSYAYKNWLAKTTTLNDIYKNMGMNQKPNEERKLRRQDQFIDDAAEYEEGDVTGFMVEKPLQSGGINSFDQFSPPQATAGAKTGYHYGPTAQQDYSYYHSQPASYHPPPSSMKSIGIKDLFDIALTTLAFLSFGMFIIQVIMCITMAKGSESSVMLPMEMTADGGEIETAELEVRVKRSIEKFSDKNIRRINEVSKRTLQSIEAFMFAKDDGGRCLKKFICENNKHSRKAVDIQKYTIPIFGISLSYLSGKLNGFPITSNLETLQASLIGLGNGNCSMFKCTTETLISRRK